MTIPGVPLNPDGTPNLGGMGSTSVPNSTSPYTIYDVPKQLTDYLNQVSGGKLWFDIGHRTSDQTIYQQDQQNSAPYVPGLIGADNGPGSPYQPGSANAAEHDVTTKVVHKNEAYDIKENPYTVMAQMQAMQWNDPQKFLQMQEALAATPFGKEVHVNGVFDPATQAAMGQAMWNYVQASMGTEVTPIYTDPKTGKTSGGFVAFLLQTAATAQANGGGGTGLAGAGGTGSTVHLMDPASIAQAAQSAAQQALGHGLTQQQLQGFINQFQMEQLQNAEDQYTTNMKLPGEAMAYAQSTDQKGFAQEQTQSYINSLVNMFAPSGSQRPSMQPAVPMGGSTP